MRRWALMAAAALARCGGTARAQPRPAAPQRVAVPSLDGTQLGAVLFDPGPAATPRPAVLLLHGCGGLFNADGNVVRRETAWAGRLLAQGYAVLAVDSFGARGVDHGMCSPDRFVGAVYAARAADAYGALQWLQHRPNIAADRIAVMGWSEGGGAVLNTIRADDPARPAPLPGPDFRAAVAFYPASCSVRRQAAAHGGAWRSPVPLLVLVGGGDVWTPAAPCQALIGTAAATGTQAEITVYPGAYHDFDWPGMPVHAVPRFRTPTGVVPIEGEDAGAEADAQQRVAAFLAARLAR